MKRAMYLQIINDAKAREDRLFALIESHERRLMIEAELKISRRDLDVHMVSIVSMLAPHIERFFGAARVEKEETAGE